MEKQHLIKPPKPEETGGVLIHPIPAASPRAGPLTSLWEDMPAARSHNDSLRRLVQCFSDWCPAWNDKIHNERLRTDLLSVTSALFPDSVDKFQLQNEFHRLQPLLQFWQRSFGVPNTRGYESNKLIDYHCYAYFTMRLRKGRTRTSVRPRPRVPPTSPTNADSEPDAVLQSPNPIPSNIQQSGSVVSEPGEERASSDAHTPVAIAGILQEDVLIVVLGYEGASTEYAVVQVRLVQGRHADRIAIDAVDFVKVVASLRDQNFEFDASTNVLAFNIRGREYTYQTGASNFGLFLLLAWRSQQAGHVIELRRMGARGTSETSTGRQKRLR